MICTAPILIDEAPAPKVPNVFHSFQAVMPMLLRLTDRESQENQEKLITQHLTANCVALHVTLEQLISYAIGGLACL